MKDSYRVKDLYLAAYIYSQHKDLIKVEREGSVCWFIFNDKIACEVLASQYWANKATGKIKSFTEAIRGLKDLIFSYQ